MLLFSEILICESISLTSVRMHSTCTSGMHSDELLDYSGKTTHEHHISIGKVTTKAASPYLFAN